MEELLDTEAAILLTNALDRQIDKLREFFCLQKEEQNELSNIAVKANHNQFKTRSETSSRR